MTESPSVPMRISMNLMPLEAAASASESLMGLDALEMSVSPTVKRLKPPPVPETATLTWTSGCSLRNSSATAWVTGKTVEEPSIWIVPLRVAGATGVGVAAARGGDVGVGVESPQAAAKAASAATRSTSPLSLRYLVGIILPP